MSTAERNAEQIAVRMAESLIRPLSDRWECRIAEAEEEARLLLEDLCAGVDPVEALARMAAARRNRPRQEGLNVERLWEQAWEAWDGWRPDRDGLRNPFLPELEVGYGVRKGGSWRVAEHLLAELDEWHPSAELAAIGGSFAKMRGDDIMAVVLRLANKNQGRLRPERSGRPTVQYRLVVEPGVQPPPVQGVDYDRDTRKFVAGEMKQPDGWGEEHLVPVRERVAKRNRK